jgi:hypothetical protein
LSAGALLWSCALAAATSGSAALAAAVDGISDQGLPPITGPTAGGPLPALLADPLQGAPGPITLARYVVQWDALAQPPGGAEYGPRLQAWLSDAAAAGLVRVLSLTSYGGPLPGIDAYAAALNATLLRARAIGAPVAWVEPWNEPNNQGRAPAALAAAYANAAQRVCARLQCAVVAGDLEDAPGSLSYERAYERGLGFAPVAWGVHPYRSVAAHDDAPVLALRAALPPGAPLWLTEVAAAYCRRGAVLGEAAQAGEAAYLRTMIRSLGPAHTFYYGVQYAQPLQGACGASGGEDTQLFAPGGRPRAAAAELLGAAGAPLSGFGPVP